jgi:hypothetical protein
MRLTSSSFAAPWLQRNGCFVAFFWIGALKLERLARVSNTCCRSVTLHFRVGTKLILVCGYLPK